MWILRSDCKSALIVFVLVSVLIGNSNGCLEWDSLAEDLFPALSPLLSSATSFIKELLSLDKIIETTCQSCNPAKRDDYYYYVTHQELKEAENECAIPSDLVANAMKCGRELSKATTSRDNKLVKGGANLNALPTILAHFHFSPLSPDEKKASKASKEMLAATKVLQTKICSSLNVTPNTFMAFLEHEVINSDAITCKPYSTKCGNDKYRSYDGTCNNLQKPGWGRKRAPFSRISAPWYSDGIYAMPVAKSGRPLPLPREITTKLFSDVVFASPNLNYLNMQWGQFITHDMMKHLNEGTDEGGINCCVGVGTDVLPPDMLSEYCIPLIVPKDDPFYKNYGIRCLNLVRSLTTPRDDCSLGYAEQMNAATSYLDGSHIYGLDKTEALALRTKKGGQLRTESKNCKRGYLPNLSDKSSCDLKNVSDPCYLSGDTRVNQTPPLAALHTLFVREHNRVAAALCRLNPTWSDEKLYQETRRIVIAELQHITYQEWLPLNLGESYVRYYRISPSSLYTHDYSPSVNAAVINGVSAAALRAFHVFIPDTFLTCPAMQRVDYAHFLSDYYLDPSILERTPSSMEALFRGLLTGNAAAVAGPRATPQVSRLLFRAGQPWGQDLIAMDVQRGRDHGIGSYNDFREICGLRRAKCFQDLSGEITQDRITALSQVYESVDDIDMYVGGIMERPVQGSTLGPLLQCVVAEQFYRTRVGDRFFYDNGGMPHSFTTDQLYELKKASLARIICDNTDIQYMQRRAFERESGYNPQVYCESIPHVDLSAWRHD